MSELFKKLKDNLKDNAHGLKLMTERVIQLESHLEAIVKAAKNIKCYNDADQCFGVGFCELEDAIKRYDDV